VIVREHAAQHAMTTGCWRAARPEPMREARDELADALDRFGWGGPERLRVLVAAGEAMANALEHGSLPDGRIGVAYRVSPRHVEVAVVDEGDGTPAIRQPPVGDGMLPNGRGILLMSGLADRVGIWPRCSGTFVLLEFRAARDA